jgi:hypothetical protein
MKIVENYTLEYNNNLFTHKLIYTKMEYWTYRHAVVKYFP